MAHFTEGAVALMLGVTTSRLAQWRAHNVGPAAITTESGVIYPKDTFRQWCRATSFADLVATFKRVPNHA